MTLRRTRLNLYIWQIALVLSSQRQCFLVVVFLKVKVNWSISAVYVHRGRADCFILFPFLTVNYEIITCWQMYLAVLQKQKPKLKTKSSLEIWRVQHYNLWDIFFKWSRNCLKRPMTIWVQKEKRKSTIFSVDCNKAELQVQTSCSQTTIWNKR